MDEGDTRIPRKYVPEVTDFCLDNARWLSGHAFFRVDRDRELAADLVQETFEAAARSWATVRELTDTQQRAWLRSTLAHKATTDFRRRDRFRRSQPDLYDLARRAKADTHDQALSAIALKLAGQIIEGLPGRQREIALMRWLDHRKVPEIAAALGIAEGTVHAQLHTVRQKLRAGLGPYYPFGGDDGEGGTS